MQASIADRFGFTLAEVEGMKLSRLEFWYGKAVEFHKQELKLMGVKTADE
ncbi:MAG: hypothetical protein PQJ46_09435 [Spirochaetales bacterium]|nr:hypothetical protein [Spirochaetales bacterium]